MADFLEALGFDPSSGSLADTPSRVARAYVEMLTPEPFEVTTFPNEEKYSDLIVARSIQFVSLCEHHLLPFAGVAHIGYIPDDRILGLSKLARAVAFFSRSLQLQERLTCQIADWLAVELRPRGVGVVLEANHACMSLRGAQAAGSQAVTTSFRGLLQEDAPTRLEFLARTR